MSRLRWANSRHSLSDVPGTVQARAEAVVESLGKQVANLAEQVRQLAEQYARDR